MKKTRLSIQFASLAIFLGALATSCTSDDNSPNPTNKNNHVTKVLDFLPGVGQFTNKLPEYKSGDTPESILKKVEKKLTDPKGDGMISLGGFGGYVVVGFDQTIENKEGLRDFRVLGNSFWAEGNPNKEASKRGGSCEPGIILVAYDFNKNGIPDADEWYEIAGSEYYKDTTIKNYEITYHKPTAEKEQLVGNHAEYIFWEDNQGNSGYKSKNVFHKQSYYPQWITENKITFKGTLLPNNAVDESKNGSYWIQYSYPFGYADNAPNNDDASAIDISWAVDKNGKKVTLPGVDFIKVYTGINQEAGQLGEVSTEITGVQNLHLSNINIKTIQ